MGIEKKQLELTYYVRSYLNKIKKENINQLKSIFVTLVFGVRAQAYQMLDY